MYARKAAKAILSNGIWSSVTTVVAEKIIKVGHLGPSSPTNEQKDKQKPDDAAGISPRKG